MKPIEHTENITGTPFPAGKKIVRDMAGLYLFFVMVLLAPLISRPQHCISESRYMEIPREMEAENNWVVPTLCGVPYFEKTPLSYQMTALSYRLFGVNLFASRLPNALTTFLTAVFLYFFMIHTRRNRETAFLTAVFFLTSGFALSAGLYAIPDAPLSMALTGCLISFYLACQAPAKKAVFFWLTISGVMCGAAFLTKGFLAFAVPVLVLTAYLVWMRDWRRLFLYPWIPILAAVFVSLPWGLAIHRAEPGFWPYFFWEEHIHRFFSQTYDKGHEPWYYYIPLLLAGMLPAGLVSIASAGGWKVKGFWRKPLARFALVWLVMPFLFFSASSCKTGVYILPCFPAAAILLALGLEEAFRHDSEKAVFRCRIFFSFWGWVGVTAGTATLFLFPLPWHHWFPIANPYPEGCALGFISVPLYILWGFLLLRKQNQGLRAFPFYFYGLAPALLVTSFVLPIGIFGSTFAEYGLRKASKQVPIEADDTVYVEGRYVTAYAWQLRRVDLNYINPHREVEFWFSRHPDRIQGSYIKEEDTVKLQNYLAQSPEKKGIFITSRPPEEIPGLLPRPILEQVTVSEITVVRF